MKGTIFEHSRRGKRGAFLPGLDVPEVDVASTIGPNGSPRVDAIGLPEVTENEVMRHFVTISTKNYNIERGMYPLGSCTMKYNPKLNETLARMPDLNGLHPSLPDGAVQGTLRIMHLLGSYLCDITGFEAITLQPAAGAQGELTGLLLMRSYHLEHGEPDRTEILMPDSAHGTNPASCALAGLRVVRVESNELGEVDLDDLAAKLGPSTAGLMLTNPNTLGIFESRIDEIIRMVHDAGGLAYMDGANMNALMGIARPGDMGFDVCHLNLHKTFSTPHGGGGPGSGPVACNARLEPFLPGPVVRESEEESGPRYRLEEKQGGIGRLLAWNGHVGVFYKAYAYIRSLGEDGLREVSENAVLNANYLRARLREYFDLPYAAPGPDGAERYCMHEFVLSGDRQAEKGVKTLDMAKRLLDYGLHAPTVYFPLIVHEALMIEPTETESLESLDRFAEAMISIARRSRRSPTWSRTLR